MHAGHIFRHASSLLSRFSPSDYFALVIAFGFRVAPSRRRVIVTLSILRFDWLSRYWLRHSSLRFIAAATTPSRLAFRHATPAGRRHWFFMLGFHTSFSPSLRRHCCLSLLPFHYEGLFILAPAPILPLYTRFSCLLLLLLYATPVTVLLPQ